MPMQTYDVLSYGTIGMDRIIRVPRLPLANRTTHSSDESLHLGGKATNTASILAHWGVSVAVSGTTIGDDSMGDSIFEALKDHPGISTEFMARKRDLASMFCYIFVAQNGERVIVGMNADDNPPTRVGSKMIERCRLLTLDLYGGDERVEAARLAQSLAKPVIVGDVRDPDHPVLPYTDVAIASATELAMDGIDPGEFSKQVMCSGAGSVIVTNGSMPIHVIDPDQKIVEIMPPEVEVVDTTGAGDAFRAGVVYGVLNNMALLESATVGAAVGSLMTTALGATRMIPGLDTVMDLANRLQYKRLYTSDSP